MTLVNIQDVLFFLRRALSPRELIVISILLPSASFTALFHFSPPSSPAPLPLEKMAPTAIPAERYTRLATLHGFNGFGNTTAETQQDDDKQMRMAAKSSLPFALRGLLSNSDARLSMAVIQHKNQQILLSEGETLPATDAAVARIFPDRLVIRRNGHYEAFFIQ